MPLENSSPTEHHQHDFQHNFDLGTCIFHPATGELTGKDSEKSIHLEPKVAKVLLCLVSSENEVVTREELFDFVWPNALVSDDSLNRCISLLRKKVKIIDDNTKVKTHPKIGFSIVTSHAITLVNYHVQKPLALETVYTSQHRVPYIFLCLIVCTTIILTILVWTVLFPKLVQDLSPSVETFEGRYPIQFHGLTKTTNSIPTSLIEQELSEVLINHPLHSVTSNIHDNAVIQLTGQIYDNNKQLFLHWQLKTVNTGEELFAGRESFTASASQQTALKVATKLVQILSEQLFNKQIQQATYINTSAKYFISRYQFQRSTVALIANTLRRIDEPHRPLLETFVNSLSIRYGLDPNRAAHIDLAITTIQSYLQRYPNDGSLLRLLQKLYIYNYQWQNAAEIYNPQTDDIYWLALHTGNHDKLMSALAIANTQLSLEEKLILSLTKRDITASNIFVEQLITLKQSFPYDFIYFTLFTNQYDKHLSINAIFEKLKSVANAQTIAQLTSIFQNSASLTQEQLAVAITRLNLPSFYKQYLFLQFNLFEQYFLLAQQLIKNKQLNLIAFWLYSDQRWREQPEFSTLVRTINLQQYWQTNGFPLFRN